MVYRGGLENRFGLTPDGGSNPSLSASLRSERSAERRLSRRSAWREDGLIGILVIRSELRLGKPAKQGGTNGARMSEKLRVAARRAGKICE